ncbi:MAG: hypothetical protein MUO40_07265 [Anaerolineaceae bacterium]|nr:hypothetical protein [Anaerolineaceae bacterium]
MHKKLILLLTLFLLLSACTPVPDASTPAPTSESTPTPTTVVHTATPTRHPTKTPTTIPTHTLLTDEEIQAWLLKNMITPECHLPCWLGITPGKSTWDSTKERVAPYMSQISELEFNGKLGASVIFQFSTNEMPDIVIFLSVSIQDNVITSMSISGFEEFGYKLPELLSILGEPGQVWVNSYSIYANYSGPRDLTLYLYYPERNLVAIFSAPSTVPEGVADYYVWNNCLGKGLYLDIMEPDENRSLVEVAGNFGRGPQLPVLPISEALDMNVHTFYEVYKDATDPICFKTQVELWFWEFVDATPSS